MQSRIEYFPISFFAMVMGLAGLTIAWEKAQATLNLPIRLDLALAPFTGLVFTILLAAYSFKLWRYPNAVQKELQHPLKLNFFPTLSVSLLLLSVCTLQMAPALAHPLWILGAGLHLLFTLFIMNVWIHHERFEIHHMNPAWFIPLVGNVLAPIAGSSLGYVEISWFFFSIGMTFWLVLLSIIFNRVLFHKPLEARMMPTLFILIAPPSVGFVSYIKLTGGLDAFAHMLYYSGLFLTLLLFTQYRRFTRLQFALSWWAYSFPLAAITIATLMMFEITGSNGFAIIGWALLSLLTLGVVFLLYRTLKAVAAGKVCQAD
jgi:tellurite resistance protein